MWKLTAPAPDSVSPTWLLRGMCCLVTLRLDTIPRCEVTCVSSPIGGVMIGCRTLLRCRWIWHRALQGLKRTLEVLCPTVLINIPPMNPMTGVLLSFVEVLMVDLLLLLASDLRLRPLSLLFLFTVVDSVLVLVSVRLTVCLRRLLGIRTGLISRPARNPSLLSVCRPAGLETLMHRWSLCPQSGTV